MLFHGWMCTPEFWRLQVEALAKDHHVVAYDTRGHGRSGTPKDGDWSLDRLADDLEFVLDATSATIVPRCSPAIRSAP